MRCPYARPPPHQSLMITCVVCDARHIYIPLGGSRHGQARRLFASLMCFSYVCLWHGMWHNIVFWVAANFIGVTLEAIGDQLSSDPRFRQLEVNFARSSNLMLLNVGVVCPMYCTYRVLESELESISAGTL